jgi:glycosyltransferase involved in cell wall biosynthesis
MKAWTEAPAARPTYLVGCDSKNDMRVFSGITYHLALQGVQDRVLTAMLNLYPRGIKGLGTYVRGGWWKLRGGIHGRHGFIFTDEFLDSVWKPRLSELRGSVVVNNFQLFGSHFLRSHRAFDITPYAYIDGTLGEYFDNYRGFDNTNYDESAMSQARAVEVDGYAACRKIVAMSKRSAAHLIQHCNVQQDKIHIVPPAANIPERLLEGLEHQRPPNRRPTANLLVVGFIGIYPERKGLPTIAGAVQLLRQTGYAVHLHVIGKCPAEIARQDGVTYFGLIDKRVDIRRFIEIVRDIDIGCMLSRAELTGIALLEFLRMGIPVIATDVGGIPDIIDLGAGELVSSEVSAEELAQLLARMIDEPDRLRALRARAWHRRHNASWRRVVRELKGVLNG